MDKIKQKREKDWAAYHHKYVQKFYAGIEEIENPNAVSHPEAPHDAAAFNRYLVWLGTVSRLYLQSASFASHDIVEDPYPAFDDLSQLEYNRLVRGGRGANSAGVVRFVVSIVRGVRICDYSDIKLTFCSFASARRSRNTWTRPRKHLNILLARSLSRPFEHLWRYVFIPFLVVLYFYGC